jgi:hypothetical protein
MSDFLALTFVRLRHQIDGRFFLDMFGSTGLA